MSGSGFYKFRCKYWLTYDCKQWVWVNNTACAECLAAGRECGDDMDGESSQSPGEIIAPLVESGSLVYAMLECGGRSPDGLVDSSSITQKHHRGRFGYRDVGYAAQAHEH